MQEIMSKFIGKQICSFVSAVFMKGEPFFGFITFKHIENVGLVAEFENNGYQISILCDSETGKLFLLNNMKM